MAGSDKLCHELLHYSADKPHCLCGALNTLDISTSMSSHAQLVAKSSYQTAAYWAQGGVVVQAQVGSGVSRGVTVADQAPQMLRQPTTAWSCSATPSRMSCSVTCTSMTLPFCPTLSACLRFVLHVLHHPTTAQCQQYMLWQGITWCSLQMPLDT